MDFIFSSSYKSDPFSQEDPSLEQSPRSLYKLKVNQL